MRVSKVQGGECSYLRTLSSNLNNLESRLWCTPHTFKDLVGSVIKEHLFQQHIQPFAFVFDNTKVLDELPEFACNF